MCLTSHQTAMVIWRQGHGSESHPTDWRSWELTSGPLGIMLYVYTLHHGGPYLLLVCLCNVLCFLKRFSIWLNTSLKMHDYTV